jgi:indolepyruvate ferredoxin oxidoreductase
MVRRKDVLFPDLSGLLQTLERWTRHTANVYLDAEALAERLFGDSMASNLIVVGAAYQAGALPLEADSIEQTIRLNGVAIEMNLDAFRWGRYYVQDRAAVQRHLQQLAGSDVEARAELSGSADHRADAPAAARQLLQGSGFVGEVRRLSEHRVPELILYQSRAYARQYVEFIQRVIAVEEKRLPGHTSLAEAVARYLFKLMAYKDEYEVARLLLKEEFSQRLRQQFGDDAQLAFNLHPPLLRAFGLRRKLRLGMWFVPVLKALRRLRILRGTPIDIFGYARVRRVERRLIREYRQLIESLLSDLTAENYAIAVQIAELPDMIRGYEAIKLASVEEFRQRVAPLCKQFRQTEASLTTT